MLAVIGGATSVTLSGCSDSEPEGGQSGDQQERDGLPTNLQSVQRKEIEFPSRSIGGWPQSVPERCVIDDDEIDSHRDIARSSYGGDEGYHPLGTVRDLLDFSVCIQQRDTGKHAQKSLDITEKLLNTAITRNTAIYFPYTFDFPLHGDEDHNMSSPWFSGMAQGEALSAFSRLAQITGRDDYREIAGLIFNSFLYTREASKVVDPWTVTVDDDGLYWIEEYPENPPAHTLNGKIFAIWGLYEYYQLTGSEVAKQLTQAAITTVYETIDAFRVPNQMSYYCLGHNVQDSGYHMIHIRQLERLYELTGLEKFSEYGSLLRSDYTE